MRCSRNCRSGQLLRQPADEELGRTVVPPPKATAAREEQRAARDNPAIRRAPAFFRNDMRTEAVREWNWALRGMDDRQLLAAADLAKRNQIWDRAINTADRTKNEHDYSLRFSPPTAKRCARPPRTSRSTTPGYGLMRQEKPFHHQRQVQRRRLRPDAADAGDRQVGGQGRSACATSARPGATTPRPTCCSAPATCAWSWKTSTTTRCSPPPLGNAGPGRAKKWRADRPLEGAIYAETIPFSETRDYVKKVMSNAVYYSTLFNGKPDSLKARLGTVGARTADAPKGCDLP